MSDLFDQLEPASAAKPEKPKPETPTIEKAVTESAAVDSKPPKKTKSTNTGKSGYTAADIEVLEGLEPVRRRPGMYVGGTDERALHHLAAEVLDNAMDEVVAGHARTITVELQDLHTLAITDDGRGIPVDPHPQKKGITAAEVILTTLHAGGKFSSKAYQTAGGLHGVGISVVNALSSYLMLDIHRDGAHWQQEYSQGTPQTKLQKVAKSSRHGTCVTFTPDPEIFGVDATFKPSVLYRLIRAKAFLFKGVTIHWRCKGKDRTDEAVPEEEKIHFPNGLQDFLATLIQERSTWMPVFADDVKTEEGRVEWALAWPTDEQSDVRSFCNTIPTPQGGTHESGFRNGVARAVRRYGELVGDKKIADLTAEDILGGGIALLSVFIPDPQFQGQTKEKLTTASATKFVESAVKDRLEHWLTDHRAEAQALMARLVERMEERKARRKASEAKRKTATRRLNLPGKLVDCRQKDREGTELFIVEGDSAGGSAKQARNPVFQAVLPLRGKILNVASASRDKLTANRELSDLVQALGAGWGKDFDLEALRYEKVIIMTDADVDGAHISSLLMTFFYLMMPEVIQKGHLFLALPPLYRLRSKNRTIFAADDAEREALMKREFKGSEKVDVSRFKGLGEMPWQVLRETTMDQGTRSLMQITLPEAEDILAGADTRQLIEDLMGKNSQARFQFIQQNARFVEDVDV